MSAPTGIKAVEIDYTDAPDDSGVLAVHDAYVNDQVGVTKSRNNRNVVTGRNRAAEIGRASCRERV